ncbi:MAG: cation diffusion facilitator family transporter [Beutenbergiaceae bacterium]
MHDHGTTAGQRHRGRLIAALGITSTVMVAEVIGAVITGSLALLSDAGHMLTDASALAIALTATWLAARPPTHRWTFGWQRAEVLAALTNGVLLAVVAVLVFVEGIQRWSDPGQVEGPGMLIFGIVGMVANIVALMLLRQGSGESLNVRGAYLEVLGDLFGSAAVIVAATIIAFTGWMRADAVASLVIAILIFPRALSLLRDVVRVLLEGAPEDLRLAEVRSHLERVDGVVAVHDLHAWTITSGVPVLSAHLVVADEVLAPQRFCEVLDHVQACVSGDFDVEHSTFQLEPMRHDQSHEAVAHP